MSFDNTDTTVIIQNARSHLEAGGSATLFLSNGNAIELSDVVFDGLTVTARSTAGAHLVIKAGAVLGVTLFGLPKGADE